MSLWINKLRVDGSLEATDQLLSLANGPNLLVKKYSTCIVNGVRFYIQELDNRRISQNSGVLAKGTIKDKNTTSMVIWTIFENSSIYCIIKLSCSSVNGIILVTSVERERYELKHIA